MDNKDTLFNTDRLADLCNEAGMLRFTPRSGYAFLGSGKENVAEHSFRTAVIGHILGRMAGVDGAKTALLCLYHDLHEARTGDFNYVNHRYNTCRARDAIADATAGTGLEAELLAQWQELEDCQTKEAMLARDADQLDLLCNLAQELFKGNLQAKDWIDSALARLRSDEGRKLAESILRAAPDRWWRYGINPDWWIHREDNRS